jgi:hypothetical protein
MTKAELEAENARLREEINEYAALNGRMQHLLIEVANAMKGPPAKGVWHDWSDLPMIARRWRNAGWDKKDTDK